MSRLKSGFKQLTGEAHATTLNILTRIFVVSVIFAAITFIGIGMIFPDAEEENEE